MFYFFAFYACILYELRLTTNVSESDRVSACLVNDISWYDDDDICIFFHFRQHLGLRSRNCQFCRVHDDDRPRVSIDTTCDDARVCPRQSNLITTKFCTVFTYHFTTVLQLALVQLPEFIVGKCFRS